MKRFLSLFLALVVAVGICFSVPMTITASAASVSDLVYEKLQQGEKAEQCIELINEKSKIVPQKINFSYTPNLSGAKNFLEKYIDLENFKKLLINERQKAWELGVTEKNFDVSKFKLPNTEECINALHVYIVNEPELLGIDFGRWWWAGSNIETLVLTFWTKEVYENQIKENQELEKESNKLIEGIKGNDSLTDVEKALLIHDRLALTCSYGRHPNDDYSGVAVYSAIVLKKAVCSGYAFAYKYLLDLVGIKSEYVTSEGLNHAWNIVYINNTPYHVDVTWDDPLPDEPGRVGHDNFLRSTQGMIETGHVIGDGFIDYNSTPTDTTYDNYFWKDSDAAFQLLKNEIYFIDNYSRNNVNKLNKLDGSDLEIVKSIHDDKVGLRGYSRLATDGEFLYYSTSKNVYKFDPETKAETLKFTLDLSPEYSPEDYALDGIFYENCTFVYGYSIRLDEFYEDEFFEDGFFNIKTERLEESNHTSSSWITDKEPDCGNTGEKHTECTVCKTVLKTEVIPSNGTHVPGNWIVTQKATTSANGKKVKKCTVCNVVVESASIPKLPATPTVTFKNSAKGINVTWNVIDGAESYVVYRSVYSGGKWSKWASIKKGVTTTTYTDTTVKLGTSYKYTVRAVNGESMSGYRNIDGLKYNVTPTVKIANASNGIKVSWSTAANATGYTVYRSQYDTKTKKWTSWKSRGTAKANVTSWTDKKVASGVQYKYTVRACNGKFKSNYKASANLIYLAQPTVKIANNAKGVKVSWSKVTGATGYTVYRSEYKNGAWTKWASRGTAKANKSSWVDTKVTSGVQYKYTVRAINGKYKSTYKGTSGLLYLAQPTTTVKAVTNGINVAWTQCDGATGYTVYRMEYNTKTKKWSGWKKMGTAKAEKSNWTDKSAKKGVTYKYTVRAVNESTKSTYKASGSVKR